jgi:hypothetical protein
MCSTFIFIHEKIMIKNKIRARGSSVRLGNLFDKHVKFEFEDKDVELTMKTMVKEPYVHHVPVTRCGATFPFVNYSEKYGRQKSSSCLYH